jgi:hypothetical protein
MVSTSTITMDSPHTVQFNSVTQYLVTFVVKSSDGEPLTPTNILVSANGGTQSVAKGAAWFDAGSSLSVSSVVWNGVSLPPLASASSTVGSPFTLSTTVGVYDATIIVKDPFGIPVGGARASIELANGTATQETTASDGTITLTMIPLGTYYGTVSFLGFTSAFSGDASTQSSLGVRVAMSYWVIVALIVVAIVVIALLVFLFHWRNQPSWQLRGKRHRWEGEPQ